MPFELLSPQQLLQQNDVHYLGQSQARTNFQQDNPRQQLSSSQDIRQTVPHPTMTIRSAHQRPSLNHRPNFRAMAHNQVLPQAVQGHDFPRQAFSQPSSYDTRMTHPGQGLYPRPRDHTNHSMARQPPDKHFLAHNEASPQMRPQMQAQDTAIVRSERNDQCNPHQNQTFNRLQDGTLNDQIRPLSAPVPTLQRQQQQEVFELKHLYQQPAQQQRQKDALQFHREQQLRDVSHQNQLLIQWNEPQIDLQFDQSKFSKLVETVEKIKETLDSHVDSVRKCTEHLATGTLLESAKRGHATSPSNTSNQTNKMMPDPVGPNGEPVEVSRDIKTVVKCKVIFQKIGEIDTLHDRFTAEVFIQSRWREVALDDCTDFNSDDINWNCYWKPKLFIENSLGDQLGQVTTSVNFDPEGRATMLESRRLKGSFQEFMELNQFPFDTQDITISITSERTDKEVVIVEDANDCCTLNAETFTGEQEWHLWKYVRTWQRLRADDNKSPKTSHSAFSCACRVSRRPGFFIWNILIVMFLICGLSFATFAVSNKLPQNRLQLAFFLVLTTVSFKFTVNQSLPMIAYLTYMDKYILSTMSILVCICVWHAVVPLLVGEEYFADYPQWADNVALMVFGAVYIGFHLAYALIIVYVVRSVKKDSMEHEKLQLKKLANSAKNGKYN